MDISVVVMAYNEVANLQPTVLEISSVLSAMGCSYEIIIIDDGSTDGTGELAERLSSEIAQVRVLHHTPNQGLGGVYRTGFIEARGKYVTFFPADGQFPATIIPQFYSLIPEADMVLGYLPHHKRPWVARSLSWIERVLYRLLLGPMPKFQGIVMFRRELLHAVELHSTGRGWAVLMEFILRIYQSGYRVKSVPTEIRPRLSGTSKVNNFRTIWANLKQVLALRRYL